jgi:hypothetical protein
MKYSSRLSKYQYERLSAICDDLIHCNLSSKALVAQDFLHISRYSPLMSKAYTVFYEKKTINLYVRIFHIFKNIVFLIKSICDSAFHRDLNISGIEKKLDYLFISHYTGGQNSQEYIDSYFGNIIKKIDTDRFKVAVAYINHTNLKPKNLFNNKQTDLVLLSGSINFSKLIEIYKNSLLALIKFKGIDKNIASKRLSMKARFDLFSPGTIKVQIIANHVKKLVTELSPRCVVTTYEGHSWERLCFALAKEVSPSIKCIAYQHAPIFKHQHAVKRGIGGFYDPDVILTSGKVSRDQLLSREKLKGSKILLLGSGRHMPEPSKFDKSNNNMKVCLVAPEGTISECETLFDFSLKCAKELKDIDFIWRLPPQIDIKMLQNLDIDFKALEGNISISHSSLESDIGMSNHILYRGSSVVIQAVASGLNPIYFMQDDELPMDPLFSCYDSKRTVKSPLEFKNKMRENRVVSDLLRKYCKDMYTGLNIKVLTSIK